MERKKRICSTETTEGNRYNAAKKGKALDFTQEGTGMLDELIMGVEE